MERQLVVDDGVPGVVDVVSPLVLDVGNEPGVVSADVEQRVRTTGEPPTIQPEPPAPREVDVRSRRQFPLE
ncbi:MAG: hypothetical protein V5A40_16430 [Haloarculaceae archaeon]